jgi:hypothetical protein
LTGSTLKTTRASGSQPEVVLTQTSVASWSIYNPPSSTDLRFYNGSDLLTLTSSGNLGLGVTPSAWSGIKALQVSNQGSSIWGSTAASVVGVNSNGYNDGTNWRYINSAAAGMYQIGATHAWNIAASGTAGNAITFTQAMTLGSNGNLLLGTTTDEGRLTIAEASAGIGISFLSSNGNYAGRIGSTNEAGTTNGLDINSTRGDGKILFKTSNTERARIDSSGSLLVGSTSIAGNAVEIYNNSNQAGRININKTTSGLFNALVFTYSGTTVGSIDYSNTGTAFNTSSDIRLKKDIVDAGSASAKIDQIRIVSHGWKHDDAVVEFGVIAQELVNIAPQAVAVGDDGEEIETTWGVDYSKLIPLLIKAHQEQQAIIESLKARLDAANL